MTVSNGAGDNGLLLKAVFWDMDGTLIDSEPYWHEGELKIAAEHGGYWDEDLAWQGSGTPVPDVARRMVEHGCQLSIEEIGKGMILIMSRRRNSKGFPGSPVSRMCCVRWLLQVCRQCW